MFRRLWDDAWARHKTERALAEHYSLLGGSPPKGNWKLSFIVDFISKMGS